MPREIKFCKGRRKFLIAGGIGGAAFLLGVYFKTGRELPKSTVELWRNIPDGFHPNAWLSIDGKGAVTVRINHSEMGQGITTALSMIIAEELEADWSKVDVQIAPADAVYKNPAFNTQMTAASTSVRTSWDILRKAGATAREMLIAAAAGTWNVPAGQCRAETGIVVHNPTQRRLAYGELTSKAAQLPIPGNVTLKKPENYRIIGHSYLRLDTIAKITGEAVFGIDVQLPSLLTAKIVRPPIIGATLDKFDARRVNSMPGVGSVLAIDSGVAVVADTFWQAKQAADMLEIKWSAKGCDDLSSEKFSQQWAELAAKEEGRSIYKKGDVQKAMSNASKTIRAVYELPFQGHATPEPMNCTAYVRDGKCDIWAPTQHQDATQEIAAKITGLPYKDVTIHTTFVGGGLGRRIAVDYVAEAVQISKAMKKPVKVIWTREDDIQNDLYRPASYNVVTAGMDQNGLPIAWAHKIVGPDHMAQALPGLIPSMIPYWAPRGARNLASSIFDTIAPRVIPGKKIIEGAGPLPYAIDNLQVNYIYADPGIPTGFWRSVAYSQNTFVVESFLDEIAAATGRDSFDLRDRLLVNTPLLRNVLRLAAEKIRWQEKPAVDLFRGIAALEFHDTLLGMIAEVSVSKHGEVRVKRFVCAVDCGVVINPKIVVAQIESGITFGLTATFKGQITINKGQVNQSNFDEFPLLSMHEMPQVEVYLVPSSRPPTGIGETAVPLVAPAVANAVFAATGKRIRKLPIDPDDLLDS
ncbi:MAG: xanthine dehydrogenase family protein molybdopterin-binding subunit [Deltaproteobacteria bacterium]|nr:MAG: xanthine dehydrogenase family protein molybdopterin-binding subunit [Deltaproteobacteria bacterium]